MDMTLWDKIPEAQRLYFSRNGRFFNKKLCDYAVGMMRDKKGSNSNPYTRDYVEGLLANIGVNINSYDAPYDAVYIANMVKNDFFGSSITDEIQVAKYVNDVMTDPDGYEGMVLNRWLADMAGKGKWIDWERMV